MNVELWVQAEVLPVRLGLVPAGGTGHLETLTLRAVAAGIGDVDTLSAMFGLPTRLTLDVIGDLWRAGRVGLDDGAGTEAIVITSKGEQELADLDEKKNLPSGYRVTDSQQVLLEKLTGRILPPRLGQLRPQERSLVVPVSGDDPSRGDINPDSVITAAMADLEDRRQGRNADEFEAMRVITATVTPETIAGVGGGGYRYVRMTVDVRRTQQDTLDVEVVEQTLPLDARLLATRRLNAVLNTDPRPPLAARLRQVAKREPFRPLDVSTLVAELGRRAEALMDCAPNNRQREHDLLARRTGDLYQHGRSRAQQELDVQLIQSEAEHRAEILSLINGAQHQLVLAVPWVHAKPLIPFVDALIAAVTRGCQVFLLWGIRAADESLPREVESQLLQIRRQAAAAGRGGDLHYAGLPALLHAKVVVADDRRSLVTSRNFFSGSSFKELGVVLVAPDDRPAPLIEDLLNWAHRVTPSAAVADRIARHRSAFGPRADGVEVPELQLPRFGKPLVEAPAQSPLVRAWADGWRAVVSGLDGLLHRERAVVSLVTDGLHRALFDQALTTAERRIIVSSDGFSSAAVSGESVAAARSAAARGVDVTFVYARGKDEDAAQRLQDLLSPELNVPLPIVRKVGDHHAKVLLWDDSVVIGSYNYLSRESSRRRGRSTGEVSVQIDAPWLADEVAERLQRSAQSGLEQAAAPATPHANTPSVPVALAAQQVVGMLSEGSADPVQVAAELQSCEAADEVLALVGSQAGDSYLERALAALVHDADGPAWQGWLQRLVGLTWRRGAWWASTHLCTAMAPGLDGPSPRLAAVAGASPAELAALLTLWVDTDAVPFPEQETLGLISAIALLHSGDPLLQEPLERWEDSCRPSVQRLLRTALAGTATYGPLPTAHLLESVHNASAEARLRTCWDALERALGELRRYKPHSPEGERLLGFMFGRDVLHPSTSATVEATAELAQLESIIDRRDSGELTTWAEAHLDTDDRRWLDGAGSRAGLGRAIDDGRRTSFITKFRAIRRSIEDVAVAAGDVRTIEALAPGQLELMAVLESELVDSLEGLPDGWDGELVRCEVDRLVHDLRGEKPVQVLGRDANAWRFARLAVPAEDITPGAVARRVAADLCSAWTPTSVVDWLVGTGEYAVAEEIIRDLGESRTVDAALEAALANVCMRAKAAEYAQLESEWALIRARADCAGLPVPAGWLDGGLGRSTLAWSRQRDAEQELDLALGAARMDLAAALEARPERQGTDLFERIRLLVEAGELVAARRALDGDDDGIGLVPVLSRPPAWPFRSLQLTALVYQFRNPEHRYPAVEAFVPAGDDVDAQRFVDALDGLRFPGETATTDFVEALQLLIEDSGVPRRLKRVQRTDALDADDVMYTTTLVMPHLSILPRMRWVGSTVTVTVGQEPFGHSLFCLAPEVAAARGTERVVDVAALLPLLVPIEDRAPSRRVRAVRFLRAVCAKLPLARIVDPDALEPLDSADARVRLWTLLHVLGFDLDDIARASIVAAAGDHPRLLWRLIEAGLSLLRDPDVPAEHLDTRWDTPRLLARYDFDALVRRAVEDEVEDELQRAILAAVAFLTAEESPESAVVVDYVVLAGRSETDRHELGRVVTMDSVERSITRLQELRYLQRDTLGRLRLRDDLVGRSLVRNDPAQWLEDEASALVAVAISPEERLVREFSHEWLQSYRNEGPDPQSLGPIDIRDPDVPCWASRWAALMVQRQEVHNWFTEHGISVQNEVEPELWIPGPATAFALTLRNLLHNARTALVDSPPADGDRGRIAMSLSADTQAGVVRLEVADNGPGLSEVMQDKLNSGVMLQREQRGYGLSSLLSWAGDLGWQLRADRHPHLGGARLVVLIPQVGRPDDA